MGIKHIQILRGLIAKIKATVLRDGELVLSTDEHKVYVGDTGVADGSGMFGLATDAEVKVVSDKVDVIEGDVTTAKTDITNLKTASTNLQNDMTTVKGDITTIKGNITTIQGDITDVQGDITDIQNDVTTIQGDVTNIKTDYARTYTANKVIVSGTDGKLKELAGTDGQLVSFNATGVPVAVTPDFPSKADVDANTQDIADIMTDYMKTAGGNTLDPNGIAITNADGKLAVVTGTDGQIVQFDANGVPKAVTLQSGGAQKYTATIGDGASTTITITHNLNTTDVVVDARQVATNQNVWVQYAVANANAITMTFATAPAASSIRVVVIG